MIKKILLSSLLIFFLVLSFNSIILAQDTTDTDWDWDDWKDTTSWSDWNDWDFDIHFGWDFKHPSITLNYGLSKVQRNDLSEKFAKPNLIEVKLGYTYQDSYKKTANIIKYRYRYFHLSNISTEFTDKGKSSHDLKTNTWRFGFGRSNGYGYSLGQAAIIPYTSSTFDWSRIEFNRAPNKLEEKNITDLYHESFRFGTSYEGGVRIQVVPQLMLEGGYERSIVFERHLFWKWLGSFAIETGAHWLLDEFIEKILESSPYAGPIINAVLKSALAYGIYELRQEKMNWPFESSAPIAFDQFKFGLTFVF